MNTSSISRTVYPHAKINIGLYVVERRQDGYHNLQTVFYPLALSDRLTITPNGTDTCTFRTSGLTIDGDADDNLIMKTYRLMQQQYAVGGVDIVFEKNIPMGAGLGGGSADAAFTAKELDRLFGLGLSDDVLRRLVGTLGADCPFFIDGKPAYAEGIGDILTPVALSLKGYQIVLVKPDVHVSTAEAYRGIRPAPAGCYLPEAICRPVEQWKQLVCNDFEAGVFAAHPRIAAIKQQLYDSGAVYAAMSGSGSAVFGLFRDVPDLSDFGNCFVHTEACR